MDARIRFLEQTQSFVKPGGYLLIVEPAQRVASQGLSLLRDTWRGGKTMTLQAPCFGLGECPMGMHQKSWCHTSFYWEQPDYLMNLMDQVGFEPNPISLSYLLWQKRKRSPKATGCRLVSQPVKRRNSKEVLLACNEKNQLIELPIRNIAVPKKKVYRGRSWKKET